MDTFLHLRQLFGALLWTQSAAQCNLALVWSGLSACVALSAVAHGPAGQRGLTAQPSRSGLACLLMAGAPHHHRHWAFVLEQSDTPAASKRTALTAALHVNSLLPLIMCEEGKSSLPGQLGTRSLLKFWRIEQLPPSCWPGCVLDFPFCSDVLRDSTTVPEKTRGDCCTCL